MICRAQLNGLGLNCGPAPAVPPGTFQTAVLVDPNAAQNAQKAYDASMKAYASALANLNPSWKLLPTAPYPPSSDPATTFQRTGTQSLLVSPSKTTAAQLAEPARYAQSLSDQAQARRPKLNALFVIGAACLAGFFFVRRSS